jgi:hypothetical protein
MSTRRSRTALALAAAAVAAAALPAAPQLPPRTSPWRLGPTSSAIAPGQQGQGQGQTPQQPQQPPQVQQPAWPMPQPRSPFDPVWQQNQPVLPFQGFPLFPSNLGAFGQYPVAQARRPGDPLPRALPRLLDEAPSWPSWIRAKGKAELPYEAGLALLVRNADRVWFQVPGEDAAVPLYFHDKLRVVPAGTRIEVRQAGEFELLLHGGSRVTAQGPTDLVVTELGEQRVALVFAVCTRLRLSVFGSEHAFGLPDGSTLIVPADPERGGAPAAPAPPPIAALLGPAGADDGSGAAVLVIDRASEPASLGGRATIFNGGTRAVAWRHAFGESRIEPGHRVTLFLQPPAAPLGGALVARDVEVAATQGSGAVLCRSRGGEVTWSGARFKLPPDATLRLDPMLGRPFAPRTSAP